MFDPIAYINEPRWQQSRLGLDRIRELLDRLGRPQDRLRFVHVAGTNGKGSTCVFLASVLHAAGYRTGLFTSPYIETFEERIRVDGRNIGADDLMAATLEVRKQAEAMADHPTEFELMCAVALVHFARCACDVVVLEVGLGGRFDATNVIDAPEVSVIARIGLDHTALLGTTLAAIAGEKAGIVKPGAPVVSYPQEPEAMDVVRKAAAEAGVSLAVPDFSRLSMEPLRLAELQAQQAPCRTFSYAGFRNLQTALLGAYQPANAALAIEAIGVLRSHGWDVSGEAVRSGIASARWPGRFEVVARRPLFIVDGGHNPQGARALVDTLREVLGADAEKGGGCGAAAAAAASTQATAVASAPAVACALPDVQMRDGSGTAYAPADVQARGGLAPARASRPRVVFVVGVLEDKDYPEMLEAVLPHGDAFVAIAPDNPRALSADKLARAIRWTAQDLLGCSACAKPHVARNVSEAVERACALAGDDGVVVAFGSLYAVAALKRAAGVN